jgi:hypothetical protein
MGFSRKKGLWGDEARRMVKNCLEVNGRWHPRCS